MKLKMLPLYMGKVGKPLAYAKHVTRLDEVPYGGKLGFYLVGNKCWLVSEYGYYEADPNDFKEKLYMLSIPSLSDKELADLRNKILGGSYTHEDAKNYNYCLRRTNLTNGGIWQSNMYFDLDTMPSLMHKRYYWR